MTISTEHSYSEPAATVPIGEASSSSDIDPNNPPWSVAAAVLLWLASVAALFIMQAFAFVGYGAWKFGVFNLQTMQTVGMGAMSDPNLVLLLIAAVIPAHLATFGFVWMFVTNNGRRPFWSTLGWSWTPRIGLWASVGLAIVMLVLGYFLVELVGGGKTQLEQIIQSSYAARFTTAFLAAATAPLVEELVYRGVLYPALQRAIGMLWAIVGVAALFALVHVPQYDNNLGVIAAVGLLSFALTIVRALTGRLLPCFVIHFVFNGLQALALSIEPFIRPSSDVEKPTATILHIAASVATHIVQ